MGSLTQNMMLWKFLDKKDLSFHLFSTNKTFLRQDTVDVRNAAHQLRLVVYPIIYRFLYIQTVGFTAFLKAWGGGIGGWAPHLYVSPRMPCCDAV